MCSAIYAEGAPADAAELAPRLLIQLQARWGGMDIYIPALDTRSCRDAAIRKMFNGQNLDLVCRQFGVSPTTVYRVVAKGRSTSGSDT